MSAYTDRVIADGATGFWPLTESVSPVASLVGSHPGTVTGDVTLNQPGPMDGSKSAVFGGVSGRISMGDDAAFEFTGAFTVEMWIKYTSVGQFHVSKILSSLGGWFIGTTAGNAFQFFAGTSAGATVFNVTTTFGYNNGLWHHVAGISDGVAGASRARIAVDGAVRDQGTINAGAIDVNAAPFYLGSAYLTPTTFFVGSLAMVAVYPLALTPAQLANHYNLGLGGQGGAPTEFRSRYRLRDAA